MSHPHSKIIDALGGTAKVSQLCGIRMPSVSSWRNKGIPKAWYKYFMLLRPDVFSDQTSDQPR